MAGYNEQKPLLGEKHEVNEKNRVRWYLNRKLRKIAMIGTVMGLYSITEIGFSLYVDSLLMLADGLHNASDAIALVVAFWAEKVKNSDPDYKLTYGYRRTEVIGGLFNGLFLLSMAVFIMLQAIPDFINAHAAKIDLDTSSSLIFIIIAGVGMFINIVGVTLFSDMHGHSHAGSSHGHSHASSNGDAHSDSHAHGAGPCESIDEERHHKNVDVESGHGHAHGSTEPHDSVVDVLSGDGDGHSHGESHQHDINQDFNADGHDIAIDLSPGGGHGHSHGHSHQHGEKHDSVTCGDGHSDDHHDEHHTTDHNMWGLFVHFLGDVLTSLLVLIVGVLYRYHEEISRKYYWGDDLVKYADPTSSVLSAIIILVASQGLVRSCVWIVMESVPQGMDITEVKVQILDLDGVVGVHHFHIWQLKDGMGIATLHVLIDPKHALELNKILESVRHALHQNNIHVSTIQTELCDSVTLYGEAGCVISGGKSCGEDCDAEPCCADDVLEKDDEVLRRRRSSTVKDRYSVNH